MLPKKRQHFSRTLCYSIADVLHRNTLLVSARKVQGSPDNGGKCPSPQVPIGLQLLMLYQLLVPKHVWMVIYVDLHIRMQAMYKLMASHCKQQATHQQ